MRVALLALLVVAAFASVQASAQASSAPPALKPSGGSSAFPVSYSVTGGSSKFQLAGAEAVCSGETGSGEFTSEKEGKLTIKLTGCKFGGKQCGNVHEGEIELKPLKSLLAYALPKKESSEGRETGLVLSPASGEVFAEFTCSFLSTKVSIKGSLIAKVTPLDSAPTKAVTLTIARDGTGAQTPEEYEAESGEAIIGLLKGSVNAGPYKTMAMEGPSTTITPAGSETAVIAARPYGPPVVTTNSTFGQWWEEHSEEATVRGTVNPEGLSTTYYLEYGPTMSYGTSTHESSAGEGVTPVTAVEFPAGLTPGKTYHYRFVAHNTDGTTYGEDMTVAVRRHLYSPSWELTPTSLSVTGGKSKLNITGAETSCTGITGTVEFVNNDEGLMNAKLTGCKFVNQCGNAGEGEIELKPLRAVPEYTHPSKETIEGRETGVVLSPLGGETLAEYTCSYLSTKVVVKGSVIAALSPLNEWTKSLSLTLTQSEGHQGISEYESEFGEAIPAGLEAKVNGLELKKATLEAPLWSLGTTATTRVKA